MKTFKSYINEKLTLNNQSNLITYTYHPKDADELRSMIWTREYGFMNNYGKLDLTEIDVSNLKRMNIDIDKSRTDKKIGVLQHTGAIEIDISTWNMSNVEDMDYMFAENEQLLKIHFPKDMKKNLKNVKRMNNMFELCKQLNMDVSNWDVSNVEQTNNMFYRCENFKGEGLEKWKTPKMQSALSMFEWCIKLDADFKNWDIHNCASITSMFYNCQKLNCNFDNWDISMVIKIANITNRSMKEELRNMFKSCNNMKKLPDWYIKYIGDWI